MIRGQKLTAIIPVRGGSKGIPKKNLSRLGKDTLLERAIKLAKNSEYVDRVLVSTDNEEMFAIAKNYGVAMKNLRPAELATDTAKTVDVVKQAIAAENIDEGYILLLQVTSPLRISADLQALCNGFDNADPTQVEAIVSLVEHDSPHPDKIQKIDDGYVRSYLGKESMVARQQLPKVYSLNGAFYLTHRNILLEKSTFMPPKTIPYVMPPERSLNLDTKMDMFLLEMLVEKGRIEIEEL
ncbi:MAG: acylneuraminate cytidylyltransferase family protein [Pseudomonadota bacterium]